jgi:hypothetical protein
MRAKMAAAATPGARFSVAVDWFLGSAAKYGRRRGPRAAGEVRNRLAAIIADYAEAIDADGGER